MVFAANAQNRQKIFLGAEVSSTVGGVRVRVAADETGRVTIAITTRARQAALDVTVDLLQHLRADEAADEGVVLLADEPVADVADSDVD